MKVQPLMGDERTAARLATFLAGQHNEVKNNAESMIWCSDNT